MSVAINLNLNYLLVTIDCGIIRVPNFKTIGLRFAISLQNFMSKHLNFRKEDINCKHGKLLRFKLYYIDFKYLSYLSVKFHGNLFIILVFSKKQTNEQ